jgi:hypothetical protein
MPSRNHDILCITCMHIKVGLSDSEVQLCFCMYSLQVKKIILD